MKTKTKNRSKKQDANALRKSISKASKQSKLEREVIIIEAEKSNIIFSTNFNEKSVKFTFKSYQDMLLKVNNKKESKHNYNINVLRVLHADSRAKKLKACSNTHYDTYYKALKLLIDKVLDKQSLKANNKKLTMYQKRS